MVMPGKALGSISVLLCREPVSPMCSPALVVQSWGWRWGCSVKSAPLSTPSSEFYRPLPPLAYLVLLIIWLGVGELSKITLLYLTALPPITISAAAAVNSVRVERINGARSLGANQWQVFCYVILPSCLPGIFTGMRISFAWTYGTVVAAEMIAANSGLGWMVLHAQRYLRTDIIFMAIFLMAFTGIVLEQTLRWAQGKLVPWAGRA